MSLQSFFRDAIGRAIQAGLDYVQEAREGRPPAFPHMGPFQCRTGDVASDTEGLFQATITDTEREELVTRCGPAKAIVVDFVEDAFDQGFRIRGRSTRTIRRRRWP